MDGWFRAPRRRIRFWSDFYKSPDAARVPTGRRRSRPGCSSASTSAAPVRPGSSTSAPAPAATRPTSPSRATWSPRWTTPRTGCGRTQRYRKERGVKVAYRYLNLEDLRSVLVTGARYAYDEHVREIYARGLLDVLGDTGRDNFWRFASMVQRRGGETFVEFRTPSRRREPTLLRRAPAHLPRPGRRRPRDRGARRPRRASRDRPRPRPARPGEPGDLSTRREVETMRNPISRLRRRRCRHRRRGAPGSPPGSPRSRPPSRRTAGSTSGSPTSSTWSPRCWCPPSTVTTSGSARRSRTSTRPSATADPGRPVADPAATRTAQRSL